MAQTPAVTIRLTLRHEAGTYDVIETDVDRIASSGSLLYLTGPDTVTRGRHDRWYGLARVAAMERVAAKGSHG